MNNPFAAAASASPQPPGQQHLMGSSTSQMIQNKTETSAEKRRMGAARIVLTHLTIICTDGVCAESEIGP